MRTLERSLLRTLERALERTTQRDANTRQCNAREEKGREVVGSPPIHNVTQVTREPVDAWMDELDLDEDVPCMGVGPRLPCIAGNPAALLLKSHTPGGVVMCWECWAESDLETLTYPASREPESRDEHYTIVEVLR